MSRIAGIARYEFLMHWRRRALRVVALTLLLCASAGALIVSADPNIAPLLGAAPVRDGSDVLITLGTLPVVLMLVIFVFPIVIGDSVLIDVQGGTTELLDSTPITVSGYLAGKLLGVWTAGLTAAFAVMVVTGGLWALTLGAYFIGLYLEIWIVAAAIIALNGGLALLIGATQPTRGRAAVLLFGVFALSIVLGTGSLTAPTPLMLISPARLPVVNAYMIDPVGANGLRLVSANVAPAFAAGIVELGVAFAAVWVWMRWQKANL